MYDHIVIRYAEIALKGKNLIGNFLLARFTLTRNLHGPSIAPRSSSNAVAFISSSSNVVLRAGL